MDRLKEPEIRLPERGHVVKAAEARLLQQASNIVEDAEKRAESVLVSAHERYLEEERRGHEAGEARAGKEAVARLLNEQAAFDAWLSGLEEELTRLVSDCMRHVIGLAGKDEVISSYVTHAIRTMRRQKRIRLNVSPGQFSAIREQVERVTGDFPEIEFIDVQESPALEDQRFVMESESARIEGSVDGLLTRLEELLLSAIRQFREENVAPAFAVRNGEAV